MLKGKCINPLIISALSHCGHGDKLLIADGNYPIDTMTADAETVYLSLSPGLPEVTQVLDAVLSVINAGKAEVMRPDEGPEPEIFSEFQSMTGLELCELSRYEFYGACKESSVRLATPATNSAASLSTARIEPNNRCSRSTLEPRSDTSVTPSASDPK